MLASDGRTSLTRSIWYGSNSLRPDHLPQVRSDECVDSVPNASEIGWRAESQFLGSSNLDSASQSNNSCACARMTMMRLFNSLRSCGWTSSATRSIEVVSYVIVSREARRAAVGVIIADISYIHGVRQLKLRIS